MTKTTPLLFNDVMIRALLDGMKTQTRRIMKPQLPDFVTEVLCYPSNKGNWWPPHPHTGEPWLKYERICPYGRPGDLLWVRETWAEVGNLDPGYLVYRATYPHCLPAGLENVPADIRDAGERWRPSIHMPRRFSRLTLRITDVRVQRLQDISEADAVAEGCSGGHGSIPGYNYNATSREQFWQLWDSINGASSFMYGWQQGSAVVAFDMHDRRIRFDLPMPDRYAREFTHTPSRGEPRSPEQAAKAWGQACRQRWRALALVIKAKLEAVESGITEFESEFLAHICLPGGDTVGNWMRPQIARAYEIGALPPLLPALPP